MQITSLDINILYLSGAGWTGNLYAIRQGTDALPAEDTGLNGIWNIQGGLEITVNGHWILFRSVEFHHLLEVSSFLLASVCLMKGITPEEEMRFSNLPENGIIERPLYDRQKSVLKLSLSGEDVLLSWRAEKPELRTTREDRTFQHIAISQRLWLPAALAALGDFFYLYELYYSEADRPQPMHTNYLKLWRLVSAGL